jgi:hypothetical protein
MPIFNTYFFTKYILQMKKKFLFLFAIIAFAFDAEAQVFNWAKSIGGQSDELMSHIRTDAAGNFYIAGVFYGTAAFDGMGGSTLTSAGSADFFVAKYLPDGTLVWAKRIGGINSVLPSLNNAFAIDDDGSVYLGGKFQGTVDFDPNAGVQNLTAVSASWDDIFLLKLDSNGDFVYVKQFGSQSEDIISNLVLDANKNVYLAIYFHTSIDSDPNAGTATLLAPMSNTSSAIVKLDAAGDFVWSHAFQNSNTHLILAATDAGELYISSAHTPDTTDLDRSSTLQQPSPADAYSSHLGFWIAKWDTAGGFLWTRTISGKYASAKSLLALSDGNLVVAAMFSDSIDFDPDTTRFLGVNTQNANAITTGIFQLSADGDFVWGNTLAAQQATSFSYPNRLSRDANNNIYICGNFRYGLDFDPSPSSSVIDSSAISQAFILKLNSAGGYLWHYAVRSLPNTLRVSGIDLDVSPNAEHLYLTGLQIGNVPFPTDTTIAINGTDSYIAKWSQTPINISVARTEFAAMQLFPNPSFDGRINIQLGEMSETIQLTIFNALGQTISTQHFQNVAQLQTTLPATAGVYFIELRSQSKSATLKAQRH